MPEPTPACFLFQNPIKLNCGTSGYCSMWDLGLDAWLDTLVGC